MPIPKPLAPLIEAHISRFCKDRKPDTMLFHSPMLDDWLLPQMCIRDRCVMWPCTPSMMATWMCRSRWSKLPAGSALHSSYLTGRPMMG